MNSEITTNILKRYYGVSEVPGEKSNPIILKWIQAFIPGTKDDSTISWCSIGLSEVCKDLGYQRSTSASARSWLTVGENTITPDLDDVVVLWRNNPSSWQGHVGLFIRRDANHIWLLGANQMDSWSIQKFDIKRVLGYRRLKKIK